MQKPPKRPADRRQPIQKRAQETVDAILEAVIRLLKRRGASAITTNNIAETAGVSIGSVYQYFPNKEAIFVALHERHIDQVDRALQRKIGEVKADTLDELVTGLLDGMIEAHASDPELAILLDSEVPHRANRSEEFSVRLHDLFRRALAPHAKSLGGAVRLELRAFLLANMLEALGHAVALRRPHAVSLRSARTMASKAILISLKC
ncbi:MAG: TetR/AcrR family transcriptional regulator [Terracidiphilus sp.]